MIKGNIVDWYIPFDSTQSDGQYDIVPWTSASESEQEEALILLKSSKIRLSIWANNLRAIQI